jgi:hypothetical protein
MLFSNPDIFSNRADVLFLFGPRYTTASPYEFRDVSISRYTGRWVGCHAAGKTGSIVLAV